MGHCWDRNPHINWGYVSHTNLPCLTKNLNFINLLFVILRAKENYGLVGVVQAEQLDLLGVVVPQHAGGEAGRQLGRLRAGVQ